MSQLLIFFGLIAIGSAFSFQGIASKLIGTRSIDGEDAVKFYLYKNNNSNEPQQLFTGNATSVESSNFNNSQATKLIIHGWIHSYLTSPNPEIREAYFSRGDYNMISVDWSKYANLLYTSSVAKVPDVGADVAKFLDFLNEKFNLDYDKLVVIGHSLGAHVAGFAGKNVKRGKLGSIVGLDPAGPLYSYVIPTERLNSTDAKYVQTVQTGAYRQGFLEPVGSAVFYGNWGTDQPGCGLDLTGSCSHARSVLYYAESVRGYSFAPIYECESFSNIFWRTGCNIVNDGARFGDPLEVSHIDGIFNFMTNSAAPFGQK